MASGMTKWASLRTPHALIGRVQALIAREQEFTRDASHELRTPLTVILSAVERLMVEERLSVAGRQHLGHVRQSALQLEQTVATLLSLAREDQPTAVSRPHCPRGDW